MKTFRTIQITTKSTSFKTFIDCLNEDLQDMNRLIEEYNGASDYLQKEILIEIYNYYHNIINKYPGDKIARRPVVAELLFDVMFLDLKKEFKAHDLLNINEARVSEFDITSSIKISEQDECIKLRSLLNLEAEGFQYFLGAIDTDYKKKIHVFIQHMATEDNPKQMYRDLMQIKKDIRLVIAEGDLRPERKHKLRNLITAINTELFYLEQVYPNEGMKITIEPNSLPDFLANMHPKKSIKLSLILSVGASFDLDDLKYLYGPKERDYTEFQQLLKTHSIKFLGGYNSKNFKVTNNISGAEWVLKIENRLKAPMKIDSYLGGSVLRDTLTPTYLSRQNVFIDSSNVSVTRGLLVTQFCGGGDLESNSKKFTDGKERVGAALNVYLQMAFIFEVIRNADAAFPDAKNTNWLIDEKGKLKIADTKSLLPAVQEIIDYDDDKLIWYGLIYTDYMSPPEIADKKISVDALHAYQLGKNLYQYLSHCNPDDLQDKHDAALLDFSNDAFKTSAGKKLRKIIKKLVKNDPEDRLSVAEALQELHALKAKEFKEAQDNCTELLNKIVIINPDLKNSRYFSDYQEKISKAENFETINILAKDLDEQLKISKAELKRIRQSCRELLDEITRFDPDFGLNKEFNKKITKGHDFDTLFGLMSKLKKIECSALAKCINNIDNHALGKELKVQIKALDGEHDTTAINRLIKVLKKELSRLKVAQQQLREECFDLVFDMEQYKIRAEDPLMFEYRKQLEDKIYNTSSLASLTWFKAELENTLEAMESSVAQEIKDIIARYRKDSKTVFSTSGKKSKADQIEAALLNVPVELRGKIFSTDPEYSALPVLATVRTALAAHRSVSENKAVFFKKGTTEIDDKKAPSVFKKLKARFTELEEADDEPLDNPKIPGQGKHN